MGSRASGFKALRAKPMGAQGCEHLGFRGLGFRGLGFRGLGSFSCWYGAAQAYNFAWRHLLEAGVGHITQDLIS